MRRATLLPVLTVLGLTGCGGSSKHASSQAAAPAPNVASQTAPAPGSTTPQSSTAPAATAAAPTTKSAPGGPAALISCLTAKHIDAQRKSPGDEAYDAAHKAGAELIAIGSQDGGDNYGDVWLFSSAGAAASGKAAAQAQEHADPLTGYARIVLVGRVVGGLTTVGSQQALGAIGACAAV